MGKPRKVNMKTVVALVVMTIILKLSFSSAVEKADVSVDAFWASLTAPETAAVVIVGAIILVVCAAFIGRLILVPGAMEAKKHGYPKKKIVEKCGKHVRKWL